MKTHRPRSWAPVLTAALLLVACKGNVQTVNDNPDVGQTVDQGSGIDFRPGFGDAPDPSACSGCLQSGLGAGGEPFNPSKEDSQQVTTDGDGALVVDKTQTSKVTRYLWVADTNLPGVVKIDLDTLTIVGRYYTGGASPSRTTVNALGEAFIGARTAGTNGKTGVTKILPDNCPDRDGDGKVTTSTGPDDVKPWGKDECVAWHVETEGDIRGLAAQDIPGLKHEEVCKNFDPTKEFDPTKVTTPDEHYVWVGGLHGTGTHGTLYKLDAETGKVLIKTVSPIKVYGAALAGDGKLWVGHGGGGFGFVDTTKCTDQASCDAAQICTQTCTATDCSATCDNAVKTAYTGMDGGYGITVDYKGRVWRSGYPKAYTMRYVPSAKPNKRVGFSNAKAYGGGIAVDGAGWVWGANISGNMVRVNADTLAGVSIPVKSKGVAVDLKGKVYAVQYEGKVHLIEPGNTLSDYKLTANAVALKGIAYAYSDMTGVQTRLAAGEPGWYRKTFDPCPAGESIDWELLDWDVEVPTGTWVMFNVRTADTAEALKQASWATVACISPPGGKGSASIDAVKGKLLEVEVRFIATGDLNQPDTIKSARIKSFGTRYRCIKVD